MVETLADPMRDGGFQSIVMKNVFVDESRELRLAARDVFRLAADACPDRIDLVEGPCGPRLILSHGPTFSRRLSISPMWVFYHIFAGAKSPATAPGAWLIRVG